MKLNLKPEAILLLEDGTVFKGRAIGKIGTTGGEICFNTGMTGYQEIYTDPSYYGQIVVNTNSHIGNYGVHKNESESGQPAIFGLIINSFSDIQSRHDAYENLQNYLLEYDLVGIEGVDTRMVVKHIRSKGAMNCIISSETTDIDKLKAKMKEVPSMKGLELSSKVCVKEPKFVGDENAPIKVAVLDLGIKASILKNLTDRGVYCKVFPAKTPFSELEAWNPDGYFISNGPGDPGVMDYAVDTVKSILDSGKPMFGICLGHQILSRATGLSTYKMHSGHRGLNHPVKNLVTGLSEITSQNHGFAVKVEDVESSDAIELTHVNLNDDTVEGIRVKGKPAFSVQHHPEASPGPNDAKYLFDNFIDLIKNKN
ncbi:glutamine-hydrolyzing carbamoyl-phosphate synthase small subunit [Aureibacter tunicatorum]|uniref:Carbamoyl phosphate synthase small chain n=1 Tax=Aureibacter tunicatorum TaxID=866807 RepID=A0AAE3XL81_9BACT|nr:glutamine-hydrolyzing carbamoyl-phosphate synthase small subunit [Aureibacter tunicatorum]MDR6237990.1 carbamoyl-phosphate synthase small subunit [Aureibacter tunicatorum]BDD03023.1 carbamoyl-phosphate synthase small chain [Aureibacter tunicatorum]